MLATRNRPSANETWLGVSSAPPSFGTFERPRTLHAIEGGRQHQEHEPEEGVGDQPERPERAGGQGHRGDQEGPRVEMPAPASANARTDPTSIPPETRMFARAMTAPRRSAGARHWSRALSGTNSRPPKTPIRAIRTRATAEPGPESAKTSVAPVSPRAPSGSRPYSTFAPESLPARTEPAPMPIPSAARGRPACPSSSPTIHRESARMRAGMRPAIVQTTTWPEVASRRMRSARIAAQARRTVATSPPSALAAGTFGTVYAATRPAADRPASASPPSQGRPPASVRTTPPTTVPAMMARFFTSSSRPFPAESRSCGRSSGRMPYLAGLKSTACTPSRTRTARAGRPPDGRR